MTIRRRFEMVAAEDLRIDPAYQRLEKPGWIKWLSENYRDDEAGIVYVSEREDGSKYVFEGQQRRAALLKRGTPKHKMRCEIYTGLTPEDEARLFRATNKKIRPSALDDFHASLAQGVPQSIAINKIVQGLGLRIARSTGGEPKERTISAISEVQKAFDLDGSGALMRDALAVLKDAYGTVYAAFEGRLIRGVSRALNEHPNWDHVRLAENLGGVMPKNVIARAQSLRDNVSNSLTDCLVATIEAIYTGRRRSRLAIAKQEKAPDTESSGNGTSHSKKKEARDRS